MARKIEKFSSLKNLKKIPREEKHVFLCGKATTKIAPQVKAVTATM
jgi:hypothetical protein